MQIKVIYSLIDNMVNFKDKNMPAVIDKALDFIGAMDVSAPTPSSMNESTAKGIFKYLKELGVPASAADITARADQEGWNPGFTENGWWAKKWRQVNALWLKILSTFQHICRKN